MNLALVRLRSIKAGRNKHPINASSAGGHASKSVIRNNIMNDSRSRSDISDDEIAPNDTTISPRSAGAENLKQAFTETAQNIINNEATSISTSVEIIRNTTKPGLNSNITSNNTSPCIDALKRISEELERKCRRKKKKEKINCDDYYDSDDVIDDDNDDDDDDDGYNDDVTLPTEQRLMNMLLRKYERAVRPVRNATEVVMIRMGLTLTQIFDMVCTSLLLLGTRCVRLQYYK